MEFKSIQACGKNVIVCPLIEKENRTDSGIWIPRKENPRFQRAILLSVGQDVQGLEDVELGSVVWVSHEPKFVVNDDLWIVREQNVMGVEEKEGGE